MKAPNIPKRAIIVIGGLLALFFIAFKLGYSSILFSGSPGKSPQGGDSPLLVEGDMVDVGGFQVSKDMLTEDPNNKFKKWIEVVTWSPRVFIYHNILSQEEAAHIVAIAEPKVQRSTVVGADGQPVVNKARTSSGYFIIGEDAQDPVVMALQKRIAEFTHLPEPNGEAFYVLRYEVGQEYVPHTDFFDENSPEQMKHQIGPAGNRIATVLTCLHGPEEGGETIFPQANLEIPCRTGNAILFWDALPESKSDPRSLHGGKPVLKGVKWAMTKWIRPRKFGF